MVPQQQIDEFVTSLRTVAGKNLQSVVLYGSAANGEFHHGHSNINLLCVLRETSFADLARLAPSVDAWVRRKHHTPLIMTNEELMHSADVFSIELLDMKRRYRVLFGDDVLRNLDVPMHLHRAQVEYELREKLILLRQRVIAAAHDDKRLWELMLQSVSAFSTLFRHALIAMGDDSAHSSREAVRKLRSRIDFDPSAFEHLFDIREGRAQQKQFSARRIFDDYLAAIQQVTTAVDKLLDSPQPRSA